jgi:hypothetical protein
MKARLAAGTTFTVQIRMPSDLLESPLKHMNGNLLRVPSNKETIIGFPGR